MQKFSACRKRGSSIHFFSSTSMRCIMAIWPAGPPKLMQPILSQSQKASPKLGAAPVPTGAVSVCTVISRRLCGPVVPLLGRMARPSEQRIIDHEPALDHAVIVVIRKRREAERDRMQSGGFRREVVACGVSTAHDQRNAREMRVALQPEQLEHRVERAALALMA